MTDVFRWGILGTGNIAGTFAQALGSLPDAELAAVGSRTAESAERFAAAHGAARAHASAEALADDPGLDAVYVATPHALHREATLRFLDAGKPVLCEKPIGLNAREAEDVVARSRERGVFLMEAMWTRFLPATQRAMEMVREGVLGEILTVHSDFGFRTDFDPAGRHFDPAMGGGALLDVGCYCVALSHEVFGGPPEEIAALASMGASGVDEQSAWVLRHAGGGLSISSSAVRSNTEQAAVITGSERRLRIPDFWRPSRLVLGREEIELPFEGNGYQYEAAEVARCVRAGRIESETMPHADTIAILETMDRIRGQLGLRYPSE